MKITLEDIPGNETEVIIRGNIADSKVQHIIALLKSSNVSSKLIVYDESTEVLIDINEVYYFETTDRKAWVVTEKGKYICKYTLSEISAMFRSHGIVQIGKSLLVNIHHVSSLSAEFSGNYIVSLSNESSLLASRFYMKEFRNAIMEG